MDFQRIVIPIAVFVIAVGGSYTAYQVADNSRDSAAQQAEMVTNESITQQFGFYQLVDKSTGEYTAGFNDTVTVYNSSGAELQAGDDYDWNQTDGAIIFYNTSQTTDGASANISYKYYENTQEVKDLSGPVGAVVGFLGKGGYIVFGVTIVIFLIAFAGLLAKRFTDDGPRSNR